MRVSKAFWLWGQFSYPGTNKLINIKEKVNDILPGPSFDVHLTLAGPYRKIDYSFINLLRDLELKYQPLKLHLGNYDFDDEIYKSFYIRVFYTENLKNLRRDIYRLKSFDLSSQYDPHISLTYGNHSILSKKNLILNLDNPPRHIFINRISLVDVDEEKNVWNIIKR